MQHASFGIPGGRSLFTPIDMAIKKGDAFVQLTPWLIQTLVDWRFLVLAVAKRPTSIFQLISRPPHYISYTDACGLGAGGVWCSGTSSLHPFLWQVEWPADIKSNLVTSKNPLGSITINDLELAGIVMGWLVLEVIQKDLAFTHIGMFADNTSSVSWAKKGNTTTSISAARFLHFLPLWQQARQASSLIPLYICGEDNKMADISSRAC